MLFKRSTLFASLIAIYAINAVGDASEREESFRLLVVGNSIVRHPPKESIGWTNDWGMAASCREKDLVHLVAKGLSDWIGKPVSLRIGNNCGIEQNYRQEIDFKSSLRGDLEWNPDFVLVTLGENLKPFSSPEDKKAWEEALYRFGRTYKERNPNVLLVYKSVFWQDWRRNKLIESAAKRLGGGYADIGPIGNDRSYQAQGLFWHPAVACHPNDKAMETMAEVVIKTFKQWDKPERAPVHEVRAENTDKAWLAPRNKDWICEYSESVKNRPHLKGVMIHSRGVSESDCQTLQKWGVKLVRLPIVLPTTKDGESRLKALHKWLTEFKGVMLPRLNRYGLSVVLACFTVPGGKEPSGDFKLYSDKGLFDQFRTEWKTIARELQECRGIVGFDICNEPHQSHESTVVDYWDLQRIVAEDIRNIDEETPIVVEAYGWDGPEAFGQLSPLKLTNVIYQVHMYYPLPYTHQGLYDWKNKYSYPSATKGWNRDYLLRTLSKVKEFERRHQARVYCGEFSAVAWADGAAEYIRDCGTIFNEYGWDWTYHAFREFPGWSVEHTGTGKNSCWPEDCTARKRVLLELLK